MACPLSGHLCSIGSPYEQTPKKSWWRHKMETLSAVLALCEGDPLATDGFPSQRPLTQSFDVFFDMHLNKRLSKQSICGDLRRHDVHCNVTVMFNENTKTFIVNISMDYTIEPYCFLFTPSQLGYFTSCVRQYKWSKLGPFFAKKTPSCWNRNSQKPVTVFRPSFV